MNAKLQSLQLHFETLTPWLPVVATAACQRSQPARKKEISWQAVYYHWQKWNAAGCFERLWQPSMERIKQELDCSCLNLDGSHAIAKRGGESVVYQHPKRAKTCNILPSSEANGFILASTGMVAGNRHDAFNLKANWQGTFKSIKRQGIGIVGAFFNADSAFDTRDTRKVCFNHGLMPNMATNKRNQKRVKRGRKRLFDQTIYKKRFFSERSFAWIDKFRALRLRDDRKDAHFLGGHHIVFAMINLRHLFAD